jgi:hypothetical protein
MIKNGNLLLSKLQEMISALKKEHPAHQKMKFIYFFLCLWVNFLLLDSNPGTPLNPDPQHWEIIWHANVWYSIVVTYMMRSNARNCVMSALKREHLAHQKINFFNFFLCLWVIFVLLDPVPGTPLNPDPQHRKILNNLACFCVV